jgi:hypothetical protein
MKHVSLYNGIATTVVRLEADSAPQKLQLMGTLRIGVLLKEFTVLLRSMFLYFHRTINYMV